MVVLVILANNSDMTAIHSITDDICILIETQLTVKCFMNRQLC